VSFEAVIFGPTLPSHLSQLRSALSSFLTLSRSDELTASAIGYYCTVTELRCIVSTLLAAETDEFAAGGHREIVETFSSLEQYVGVFHQALAELEAAGVSQTISDMLSSHFDEESPLHGVAAACIAVFLGVRMAGGS